MTSTGLREAPPAVGLFDRRMKEQKDYWTGRLTGLPEAAGPRPDFPRRSGSPRMSGPPLRIPIEIEPELAGRLRQLTSNGPFLIYTTLTAAFHACLFQAGRQNRIATGSPVRRVEGAPSADPNLVVITSDLDGRIPFKQLLGAVRETLLAAYQHQDFPFARLVRLLDLPEPVDRAPLVDVVLALEEIHGPLPDAGQDVTITFSLGSDALTGVLEAKPWLFRRDTLERFVQAYVTVLRAAVSDVGHPVGDLPLLGEGERHQLVVEHNDTALEPAAGFRTVHEAFAAQAARTPDVPAVVCEGLSLTYAELNRRANQLAHHLRNLGIGPDVAAGLCLERSADQMVALLGILKAGGAYVPMDETWPAPRLAAVVSGGKIGVVVTRDRLRERFAALDLGVQTVYLDSTLDSEDPSDPASEADGENLAYLLFTSGSTGEPKGVMVRHSAVLNLAEALRQAVYSNLGSGPLRVTVNGPLTFDTSVKQWVQLLDGHTLHILTEEARRDADLLAATLDRERVDVLDCTPSLLRLLLPQGIGSGRRRHPRAVLLGGEAIDPPLWEALARSAAGGGARSWNVYGPTECTVDATAWPVAGPGPVLGRPIANVRLHLLGRDLLPLPAGLPGELCIGGAGLARGYAARPDLTAAAFVPDPFPLQPGDRLYRTGDLARRLPDGTVEFLGRIDFQVKVRGFRIELGEIEAALTAHPAVKEAVVTAREDTPGDLRIVAYAVPQEGKPPKVEALRNHLAEKLADYMLPAAIVLLDALPLNANGKVDRRALPAPDWQKPAGEGGAAAPRTPIEEAIAAVWTEVLGLARVGIHDDFFELGGHSLLAMQVLSRVLETFRIKLPLKVVFDSPTIAGMARAVESDLQGGRTVDLPPLVLAGRDRPLPLSFAQERLWFFDQLHPEEPAYNVGRAFRLRGRLNAPALERALAEITRRHEALRTTFAVDRGAPVQRVAPFRPEPLPRVDLTALPERAREKALVDLLVREPLRPFDLARGPLHRYVLFLLGPDDASLLAVFHHIVFDGWSLGVFVQELRALYEAFAARRPSPLPDLPVQYPDFAVWQRGWLQGPVLAAQLDYWKGQLAGAPPSLDLPADRPRPALQTFRGARRDLTIPASLTAALQEVYRRRGGTLFMALLALLQTLLERWTGQTDLVLGMPTASRSRLGVEGLIGFFVNTLVLRTDLSGVGSFHGLLDRVRDVALGAYAHQDLPFEKLIEELQPERDLSRPPLIQVLFVLQNAPMEDLALPGLTLEASEVDPERVLFDLLLSGREVGDELALSFRYNADLFDPATLERFAEGYERLLAAAVKTPEVPLAELPLLSAEERHHLTREWNDTALPAWDGQTVLDRFAALAERDPEGLALRFEGKDWTRRELLAQVDRRATSLRALGVGPGSRIAIAARRTPETLIAILSLLRTGASYLPIDPEDPEERHRWILEDALAGQSTPDTAYLLYTSGSTGRPKGVEVSHGALRNLTEAQIAAFDLTPGDRLLQFAALTFDASASEIFTALVSGATLVLAPRERILPGPDLLRLLQEERITAVTLPPSALAALPPASEAHLPDLRSLVVAGETCPPDLRERWSRRGPGHRFLNAYGPTETTVCATVDPEGSTIGHPIPGVQVYLLKPRTNHLAPRGSIGEIAIGGATTNHLAPRGSIGEIAIGGAGVARGYLNRPDLTADRFVPDPFADEPGRRLFRTGDLGRQRADGRIEFLGRIDHQLKVRGFRIEPGEIETALRSHPQVQEAVVLARPVDGLPVLVAYVVPTGTETGLAEGHLRDHLRRTLPAHMIPGRFMALDALPLTPHGKIDRRALPTPDTHRPGRGDTFIAPRNETEAHIASIWAETLGLDRVGIHDDFFELGGHSLLATRLLGRLREELGLDLPVRALFEHPSVAGLAAFAEAFVLSVVL